MNPFKVFQGCMRLLTVHNQLVDLIKVQQRLMGNHSHLQIDMCGIIDRSDIKNTFDLWCLILTGSVRKEETAIFKWVILLSVFISLLISP